jgi:hypothetical protein
LTCINAGEQLSYQLAHVRAEEGSMPAAIPLQKRRPVIAAVGDWWHALSSAQGKRSDAESCSPGGISGSQDAGAPGFGITGVASHGSFDVSLLFRRMAVLHIDRDDLARDEPLLFRELQALCVLCRSRGRCRSELAREFADPAWQDWRDYCPNATTLSLLSVVQMCSSNRA